MLHLHLLARACTPHVVPLRHGCKRERARACSWPLSLCWRHAAHMPAGKHVLRCRPQLLSLNCTASRIAVIDINGVLSFFDCGSSTPTSGGDSVAPRPEEHLSFERKVGQAHVLRHGYMNSAHPEEVKMSTCKEL